MGYTRTPLRGFRKFAFTFWTPPSDSTIYGTLEVDVTKARRFQEDVKQRHGVWPSIAQLAGRAIAVALMETPDANSKIIWNRVYVKDTVDVYFQVDVEDGRDLSGVVVNDTGRKSILDVSRELGAHAERLRGGQDQQYEKTQKGCFGRLPVFLLRPLLGASLFLEYNLGLTPTLLGARKEPFGTVMVTNVSKFDVDFAYAPLVPPSRVPFLVLVGRVADRPWAVNGRVEVRPVVTLNATFDHRVIDGNKIGRIIRRVRAYMDNPYAYEQALGLIDPDGVATATGQIAPGEAPQAS